MILRKRILVFSSLVMLASCAPESDPRKNDDSLPPATSDALSVMRTEFMESCQARKDYARQKKAGTLNKLCKCIFKRTMQGLSLDEQRTAAFYLYGESNADFRERFVTNPPDLDAMPAAVEAVAKAAKTCR